MTIFSFWPILFTSAGGTIIEYFFVTLFQTSCDVSAGGDYILTGSTGFNGSGCEVTVSISLATRQTMNIK